MRNKAVHILSFLILLVFVSCNKDELRTPNFFVEFATVINKESSVKIQFDNGKELIADSSSSNLDIKDSSRVIINYTPIKDGFIKINQIQQIFLGNIEDKNFENLNSDPIKVISIDKQGNYINISFQADYHSKPHSISLFRDTKSEENTKLYLSYSREDDPVGAPTQMYASFKLDKLQNKPLSIFIKTYDGERKYNR